MLKRMLIDASHPEETRVVVLDGQKVEEFDFEAASKRPLKGNIYLAKVTRVEPSLQAAFVEYGGNRQGFLAFSEIHPDYYQIPVADRQALLAEQMAEARRHGEDEFEAIEMAKVRGDRPAPSSDDDEDDEEENLETAADEAESAGLDEDGNVIEAGGHDTFSRNVPDEDSTGESTLGAHAPTQLAADMAEESGAPEDASNGDARPAQALQAQRPMQRWVRKRHYKIQEVIKRRQVMLIQVVKEERGNKGAALTTYLSLAGRYCVLMPNTPRGGGISRKITNAADRKRLKSAAASLELPDGMGLIIRTAGANRTKLEIRRDYEYLLRMWDSIRELTLRSHAPACVYEEGDLIKRAIRDLYNKDVSEVIVEGEEGYRNAKDFMRMLMPSHAKNVKSYKETVPLFHRHHIESQLDAMFSNTVTLKSGGYLVINQTEALVSIDVNSGKATREHNIEDTAYKTNLEAADEVARQLRLRDLAGLIVIDFIDMEDSRNDRNVEKRLRDAVKNDRARIQIGKISQFGLMEMSRQRLRAGVIAGSTVPCPHCQGQGIVRNVESTALRVLRGLEEEAQKQRASAVTIRVPTDVAIYTLNQKRRELMRIEADYDMSVAFEPDAKIMPGNFEIDRTQIRGTEDRSERGRTAISHDSMASGETIERESPEPAEERAPHDAQPPRSESSNAEGGRRRRRRRRGRDHDRNEPMTLQEPIATEGETEFDAEHESEVEDTSSEAVAASQADEGEGRRKRRRRRRGRRGRRDFAGEGNGEMLEADAAEDDAEENEGEEAISEPEDASAAQASLVPPQQPTAAKPVLGFAVMPNAPSTPQWSLTPSASTGAEHKPSLPEAKLETPAALNPAHAAAEPIATDAEASTDAALQEAEAEAPKAAEQQPASPPAQPRKGWWQRPFVNRE